MPAGGDHIVAPAGKELERRIGGSTPKYDFHNENISSLPNITPEFSVIIRTTNIPSLFKYIFMNRSTSSSLSTNY
ncbi:unnamed protein product [Onchocerca flexuosa]|uniref:Uncharacterized protein n=1 Tax=Onchocerca flexuosa TaxID=387005 RepID=A0A183HGE9_9BILA|nr:unnamed protein product [Onchocerca flexuosa]